MRTAMYVRCLAIGLLQHASIRFFCESVNKANLRQGHMYVPGAAGLGPSELWQTIYLSPIVRSMVSGYRGVSSVHLLVHVLRIADAASSTTMRTLISKPSSRTIADPQTYLLKSCEKDDDGTGLAATEKSWSHITPDFGGDSQGCHESQAVCVFQRDSIVVVPA